MKNIKIIVPKYNYEVIARSNQSLLEIMNKEGVMSYAPCGGKGTCGKCKVKVKGGLNNLTDEEKKYLSADEISANVRLACKTYVNSEAVFELIENDTSNYSKKNIPTVSQYSVDCKVSKKVVHPKVPSSANSFSVAECILTKLACDNVDVGLSILKRLADSTDLSREVTATLYDNELIDIENENTETSKYGVAIDIGTTTLVCYLIDLNVGTQVGIQSQQNPQTVYGSDLITRVNYCLENTNGLETLNNVIVNALNVLIGRTARGANVDSRHIYECVLVGNVVMNHLFLGLNPKSLSSIPFNPVIKNKVVVTASDINISSINQNGKVTFLPNIGGYIGSDVVGGMVAAGFGNSAGNQILIDLGTNAEIVLSTPHGKLACSAAAGPAFEGAKIKNGMQAFSGAINSVWFDGTDINYTTIDNHKPQGVCGSGLIDAVSIFLKTGIVDKSGRIVDQDDVYNNNLRCRIIVVNEIKEIVLVFGRDTDSGVNITVTQKDIREIQLAKGAVNGSVNILLKLSGITSLEIDKVLLTGAFGNFINKENASRIGLLPNVPLEKVSSLGNAAGEGAKMVLCNKDLINKDLEEYISDTRHVEVSIHPDFQDEFIGELCFR